MVYVAFMLQESFLYMKGHHDKMQQSTSKLLQELAASRSAEALEQQMLADQTCQMATLEAEHEEKALRFAATIAELRSENEVCCYQ